MLNIITWLQHPELNELIERRFSQPGDVEKALDFVHNSDGLQRTKQLAQQYCTEAVRCLDVLRDSPYKQSLIEITEKVSNFLSVTYAYFSIETCSSFSDSKILFSRCSTVPSRTPYFARDGCV